MEPKNQVVDLVKKPTLATRTKQAVTAIATFALVQSVYAASSIDAAGLTGEIDGAKATMITLFGAGLIVLGIFAGYRYLKRGANSA